MRKFLLSVAVMACALAAMAQNYVAEAYTEENTDWTGYDLYVNIDKPLTVEVFDSYVIVKGWLGYEAQDLKVAFDADENVTSITPITNGIEGDSYSSGYAAFSTKSDNYYYVQMYLGTGYDYAYADAEGGYVMLSGYFYETSSSYKWGNYYITWGESSNEELYSVVTKAEVYPDADFAGAFDGAFIPAQEVAVYVYDGALYLAGFGGNDAYDLYLTFDNSTAQVTSITPVVDGVYGETATADGITVETGNAEYPTASLKLGEGNAFAFVSSVDGYVLLTGAFKNAAGESKIMYYYLPWSYDPSGIAAIEATDAPVEYFNLQGMRLAYPASGQIVIKRQGAKVTKTIIR